MKNRFLVNFIVTILVGFCLLFSSCHSDIAALRFVFPDMASDGEIIEITQVSGNIGKSVSIVNDSINDSFRDAIYLSFDQHLGREDLQINNNLADNLSPGQLSTSEQEVEIPFGTRTGDYYLIYSTNWILRGWEPNTANNTITKPIHINGFSNSGRDLTAINFMVEQDLLADSEIRVFYTIYNFGQTTTSASDVKVYISDDDILDPSEDICFINTTIGGLAGFEKRDYGFSEFVQNDNAGFKYLFLVVDENNSNSEFDEDNNVISKRVNLRKRQPDLEITAFESPIGVQANMPIALTTRIRNSGTAPSENFQLKYFISNSSSITNGSILYEKTYNLAGLDDYDYTYYNHSITLPSNISEGTYYLYAHIDPEELLEDEYTTGNNWEALRLCVHQDFNNLIEDDEKSHAHEDARQSVESPVFSRGASLTDDFIRNFVDEQMKVYPNPTNDKTNLSLTIPKDAEVSIFLRDMTGKLLLNFNGKMQEGTHLRSLNLSAFPAGVYLIQVELEGQQFSKTIFLE